MDLSQFAAGVAVLPGRPLRLKNHLGRRLTVVRGTVWITQDRDPRDVVLAAGEDFVLDRPGLAITSALEGDAEIAVEAGVEITPAVQADMARPLGVLSRLWGRWRASRRAALARNELLALNDHTLRDIGLTRSELEAGCR